MKFVDANTSAIAKAGLFKPVDLVFTVVLAAEVNSVLYWFIWGSPTRTAVIAVLLATVVMFQLWIVILLLRIGVMVLRARADINLMPEAAARMAAHSMTSQAATAAAATRAR